MIKSRMMFVLTLAAFFNPISVMAFESSSIACTEWANGKKLEQKAVQGTTAANAADKTKTSGSLSNPRQ